MSNFVRPHRRQPIRPRRPWDSPGKNTGVSCHFLLQCMKVKSERDVAQSCLTLSDPMDCSPPGSAFPGSSASKESTCNTGDLSSIPVLGKSSGEGIGYPLQYSWASLVAQLLKNSPAMWENWVLSLGWEDPLEKGMAHSSILAWRIPWTL